MNSLPVKDRYQQGSEVQSGSEGHGITFLVSGDKCTFERLEA